MADVELTSEDRENIQNQIAEYKQQIVATQEEKTTNAVAIPITPDGQNANESLDSALKDEATPDKREAKRIKKKIKGIWRAWRTTALDAKALETEKIACQIEIERTRTQAELNKIRREEEIAEAQHWLTLNKGNLEDIDANTTSRPSKFWYGLRRGFHHITKLTNNVPKIFKNLFWIGVLIIGLVLLKHFHVL